MRTLTLTELDTEIEITRRDLAQLEAQRTQLMTRPTRAEQIFGYLKAFGVSSAGEIATATGMPRNTAVQVTHAMALSGRIVRRGRGSFDIPRT